MHALLGLLVVWMSMITATDVASATRQAAEQFQDEHPAVRLYRDGSRITRVYGPSMGFGATPRDAADAFLENHSEMFGVRRGDLRFFRSFELMHGKFTAVQYKQHLGDVRVHRASAVILVRRDVGNGIVLISADLHDMLSVSLDPPAITGEVAMGAIRSRHPQYTFTDPELIVFPNDGAPTYAYRFEGGNGSLTEPEKLEFVVGAMRPGDLLHEESLVLSADVVGNVSGWGTEGQGSDQCSPDELIPMPWVNVGIEGGASAFADENGDYVIPNGGTDPVNVQSRIGGRYFNVVNQAGGNAIMEQVVTPPGPADFEHDTERQEFVRAQVNGYVHANIVRDHALRFNPDYPVIRDQTGFVVNVNLSGSCNAFYTGDAINFFRAGGCANFAFADIIYHEYGHHLVATGGSGQGQYGEGAGDTMGVVILDDPRSGLGFSGNCNQSGRSAENFREFPCSGPIHDCGQLISGCVWDTRNELIVTEPEDYLDILSGLWINSIPLHREDRITPEITIDFLTLDDDDDNIGNGTPHYAEIDAGFGRHKMGAPPLVFLSFRFPNGRPDMIAPAGGDRVRVEVEEVIGESEPGSGKLHYSTGGDFIEIPMEEIEHNVYDMVFPPIECGKTVQYFVSVDTTEGQEITEPEDAPDQVFDVLSALGSEVEVEDDFETDTGWSVVNENLQDGAWERGVPFGRTGGAPEFDYDGSGQCYVTGNAAFEDVDGGPTRLISPSYDLEGGAFHARYARYFFGARDDTLVVDISGDDGQTWVTVETVLSGDAGWFLQTVNVGDFIAPTSTTRLRFSATDQGAPTLVEAAVDAVALIRMICSEGGECVRDPAWVCDGDVDGDGQVNPVDSGLVQAAFGSTDDQDICNYDVDCDGQINPVDSGIVQSLFGTCEAPRGVCP